MDTKKILFVTKFEKLWFDALESMMDLRKAGYNHVVFLNVIEREKVALRRGTGYQKEEEIRLREMANIRFINWAEILFERGLEVGAYIVVGSLVKEVTTAVEKEGIDLIVVGHEKKGRIQQLYAGSDIVEIIRRSSTPVLVYKYKPDQTIAAENLFERPMLATRFSETCKISFDYVQSLHPAIQKIHVVHIADPKDLKESSGMGVQKTRKKIRNKLDEICDAFIDGGIDATPGVYIGNPLQEIENAAKEYNASMIIAGISAKDSLKERLIGSTPRALAQQTIFPTLLIPLKRP
jgi:nucleotide-binding universal stress UspA family protein